MVLKFAHSIENAKTKWCPFVRAVAEKDDAAGNRWPTTEDVPEVGSDLQPSNRCIAYECMAWRWVETHINDPEGGPDMVPSGDTHSYCGLAGDPR